MCAAAIGWAQVPRLVFGAADPKRGYRVMYGKSPLHPKCRVTEGPLADECSALMTTFFHSRR